MHLRKTATFFAAWILDGLAASHAAAVTFECPAMVEPSSVRIIATAAGWTPYVRSPLYLHSAAPVYGPPEARGDIADFSTVRGRQQWSYTYKLEGNFEDGKWIQCAYGANNEVTLSQRIDDTIRQCTFTYRKGKKAAQHDIAIQCR